MLKHLDRPTFTQDIDYVAIYDLLDELVDATNLLLVINDRAEVFERLGSARIGAKLYERIIGDVLRDCERDRGTTCG